MELTLDKKYLESLGTHIIVDIVRGFSEIKNLYTFISQIDKNIIICGGYARYMCSPVLNPVPPNDIDLYFPDYEIFLQCKESLIENFNLEIKEETENAISFHTVLSHIHPLFGTPQIQLIKPFSTNSSAIKEGRDEFIDAVRAGSSSETVSSSFSERPTITEGADITVTEETEYIYPNMPIEYDQPVENATRDYHLHTPNEYVTWETKAVKKPTQLSSKEMKKEEFIIDIINTFDFSITRCGVFNENIAIADNSFIIDEKLKLLRIRHITDPLLACMRMQKYVHKGYFMLSSEFMKIFDSWIRLTRSARSKCVEKHNRKMPRSTHEANECQRRILEKGGATYGS